MIAENQKFLRECDFCYNGSGEWVSTFFTPRIYLSSDLIKSVKLREILYHEISNIKSLQESYFDNLLKKIKETNNETPTKKQS